MRTSTRHPTKAQQARFEALREIGCICCRIFDGRYNAPEIHHITSGFKRHGHDETIPLCGWHHRGAQISGFATAEMVRIFGPSLAHSKREFVRVFGTEAQLLEVVNAMLERK